MPPKLLPILGEKGVQILPPYRGMAFFTCVSRRLFRLNSRTYYGVRQMAYELGAETEVSCTLNPGADGDVSMIEHLQTRPEATAMSPSVRLSQ